jgi:carboxyl-terminal processing protease
MHLKYKFIQCPLHDRLSQSVVIAMLLCMLAMATCNFNGLGVTVAGFTTTPVSSLMTSQRRHEQISTTIGFLRPREDDEKNHHDDDDSRRDIEKMLKRWLSSALLTATFTLSTPTTMVDVLLPSYNQQSTTTVGFSSEAKAWALSPEQLLVDDVWREVSRQYFDPTFHGLGEDGWKQKRLEALKEVVNLGPPEDLDFSDDGNDGLAQHVDKRDPNEPVYNVIRKMLSVLEDPYTRFLTPKQYATLTNAFTTASTTSSSSSSSGIGVQLIGSPSISTTSGSSGSTGSSSEYTGNVIVANTISNGAAAKAGILPGDIIRKIDGVDVTSATAEVVAAQCRGETGSRVVVEIERPSSSSSSSNQLLTLTLTRSPLPSFQSVETSVITTPSSNRQQEQKVGIVRLSSFTQDTFDQVSSALRDLLETQKVDALVLDVRGNAGGYMPAGVDVAKLFLPPRARIITEVDRTGRATIYINDGVGSETNLPLYVLIDRRTASASEIMTAALQDNGRATVVGGQNTDHTFGKGRIQNVQALQTGAGVAVTKAKYLSPNGRDIHGVGITPDRRSKTCELKDSAQTCLDGLVSNDNR